MQLQTQGDAAGLRGQERCILFQRGSKLPSSYPGAMLPDQKARLASWRSLWSPVGSLSIRNHMECLT